MPNFGKLAMQSRGILRQIPQISWAFRWAEPQWNEITPPLIHPRLVASKATRDCTLSHSFQKQNKCFQPVDYFCLDPLRLDFGVLKVFNQFTVSLESRVLGSLDPWIPHGYICNSEQFSNIYKQLIVFLAWIPGSLDPIWLDLRF